MIHCTANTHNWNDKDKIDATSQDFKRIKSDEKLVTAEKILITVMYKFQTAK